ncbi:MAG TPA: SpoIIE family protein phosphatase [Roseiflexaceae bacterium]|nr:SpoIIE family protein phosphatase [Roseiflexaceae bacterium]HMP39581.1 SpoIIE family protein phosphatase [Roseiflexaceae bacterium]
MHLPQIEPLFSRLATDTPGLIVVAGLDRQPVGAAGDLPLPSGRGALLRMLLWSIMEANPTAHASIVSDDQGLLRVPRGLRRRVRQWIGQPGQTMADRIATAASLRPDVVVVDELTSETILAVVAAARQGVGILTQIDTIVRGGGVVWQLYDIGLAADALLPLLWVVSVQRLPQLCQACRQPLVPDAAQLARIAQLLRRVGQPIPEERTYYTALGCEACGGSGRAGDIAAFDIFRADGTAASPLALPSLMALESYALELAAHGYVALVDALDLEYDQLRHAQRLVSRSAQALDQSASILQRKVAELEAANRVLQLRTEALMSLEAIAQALTGAASLSDMAARVCRHARELCGADRAVLYMFLEDGTAEILAVNGWSSDLIGERLAATEVQGDAGLRSAAIFPHWPPGVPQQHADVAGGALRAGLRVPLLANDVPFGMMIVHSTRKKRFQPGEVALLQTFANHVVLSIQQSWLIYQLEEKIHALELAQTALVAKERIDRELELARQVQQSVLPQVFPQIVGITFAARSQPARRVGGDLYDVLDLGDGRVGLMIADVSDKGMPAALYMALVRSLVLAESQRELSPRAVLVNVNRLLRRLGEPHMFVTVFYGVVQVATRQLTFCRAGHDYPLLLRDGTSFRLEGRGMVLGAFDDIAAMLSEESIDLHEGDRLVLYTDGLTDVLNPAHERFEFDRLADACQAYAALEPEAFCNALLADLADYQGGAEQYDDMTLLVMGIA